MNMIHVIIHVTGLVITHVTIHAITHAIIHVIIHAINLVKKKNLDVKLGGIGQIGLIQIQIIVLTQIPAEEKLE